MKNSKIKILFGFCLMVAVSVIMSYCGGSDSLQKNMTADQIYDKYGVDVSIMLGEESMKAFGNGKANGKQPTFQVEVVQDDIEGQTLPDGRDTVTVKNITSDVTFGGVQKATAMNGNKMDASTMSSWCNWYKPPTIPVKGCAGAHTGNSYYRGWWGTTSGAVKITKIINLP